MPLRSVEAATRDDAIAAAREQFGPTARVVGVRRVRSGGVLGFFATERYVAEVASDATGRPVVPAPAASRSADAVHDDGPPSDFSSPLASATPARARAAAPARNGAAAWAAEAARASRDLPASAPAPARGTTLAPADAWPTAAPSAPARTGSQPATPRADQERVSELAGLFAPQAAAPEPPADPRARYPRADFPRTVSPRAQDESPARLDDDIDGGTGFGLPAASAPVGPSPFTAALARMVSGDRDVRQAVREALDDPAAPRPRGLGDSWPTRPGALGPADTSVAPPAARQKEETVGDQVIAPSSFVDQPVEVPAWAAEPEVAPSTSPREEAIAEVLRAALAQGHSDEALAGILRKVLAGVSPQTALAEPEAAVPMRSVPLLEAPAPVPAPIPASVAEPVLDTTPAVPPVVEVVAALPAVPLVTPPPVPALFPATPVQALPAQAPLFSGPASYFVAPTPFALPPLFAPSAGSMWGDPSPAPLWGDPVTVAYSRSRSSDAPIWDEITQQETSGIDLEVGDESASAEDVDPAGDELAAVEETTDEDTTDEDTPDELDAVEYTALTDAPVGPAEVDAVQNEADAAEAAAAEAAAAEIAAAAEAAAAEAEAAAEIAAAAEAAAAGIAAAEAGTTQSLSEPVAETTLAEQVEEALAELSADESVKEFLAEADAEAAETEASAESTETEAAVVTDTATETAAGTEIEELAPMLARTASDPAPMMSLDATTVMPPLSLLPPLPSSRGRGRPPVPPASRPLTPRASAPTVTPPAAAEQAAHGSDAEMSAVPAARSWATVTRLPVGPLMATPKTPDMPDLDVDRSGDLADGFLAEPAPQPAPRPGAAEGHLPLPENPAGAAPITTGDLQSRLEALGLPAHLLGDTFAEDVARQGTYAALTRALGHRLPAPPELPSGAGEVLFVVGPGVEALRAARGLAASLRLDRDSVQWATRGELAGLAPKGSRMTTVETAMDRRQDAASSGNVTIVAVDAPLRSDAYWMSQMLAIWTPTAVWVVVEATRKPEDVEPWLDGLPRVDALVVTDTDLSADPAAVLRRLAAPVAIVDGVRATPHRWASLLCERLESTTA